MRRGVITGRSNQMMNLLDNDFNEEFLACIKNKRVPVEEPIEQHKQDVQDIHCSAVAEMIIDIESSDEERFPLTRADKRKKRKKAEEAVKEMFRQQLQEDYEEDQRRKKLERQHRKTRIPTPKRILELNNEIECRGLGKCEATAPDFSGIEVFRDSVPQTFLKNKIFIAIDPGLKNCGFAIYHPDSEYFRTEKLNLVAFDDEFEKQKALWNVEQMLRAKIILFGFLSSHLNGIINKISIQRIGMLGDGKKIREEVISECAIVAIIENQYIGGVKGQSTSLPMNCLLQNRIENMLLEFCQMEDNPRKLLIERTSAMATQLCWKEIAEKYEDPGAYQLSNFILRLLGWTDPFQKDWKTRDLSTILFYLDTFLYRKTISPPRIFNTHYRRKKMSLLCARTLSNALATVKKVLPAETTFIYDEKPVTPYEINMSTVFAFAKLFPNHEWYDLKEKNGHGIKNDHEADAYCILISAICNLYVEHLPQPKTLNREYDALLAKNITRRSNSNV